MASKINQKEYLKKYLSSGKSTETKKKKKKSKNINGKSIKIIDDDDFNQDNVHKMTEEELEMYAMGEDAPQIVGVIDDRPPELVAKEDYTKSIKWKGLDSVNDHSPKQFKDLSSPRRTSVKNSTSERWEHIPQSSFNQSPPRRKLNRSPDLSPRRRAKRSPDQSPPRRKSNRSPDLSLRQKNRRSPDDSPPRRQISPDLSPRRHTKRSPDQLPSKWKSNRSPDLSPRRKNRRNSDQSPPRRKSNQTSGKRSPELDSRNQIQKRKHSPDMSPPRQRKQNSPDSSRHYRRNSPDMSPPRQKSFDYSSGRQNRQQSPNHFRKNDKNYPAEASSSRYLNKRNFSESPPPTHKPRKQPKQQENSDSETDKTKSKSTKTLDGKTAGLQDAKSLRIESDKHRKREDELFKKMEEFSGRNADVVVRDRRTGRIRDLEMESAKEQAKREKEQERQLVYDRWGKGLKQVEDYKARVESDLHEVKKPLARYSNDADLDDLLKKQDRDGDPMAEYMRKKQETKKSGQPSKPIYRGSYPENRFSIRPGYRWDGVDRSNGYEVKWFNVQSKKKAGEEEAYKYSTEDL